MAEADKCQQNEEEDAGFWRGGRDPDLPVLESIRRVTSGTGAADDESIAANRRPGGASMTCACRAAS